MATTTPATQAQAELAPLSSVLPGRLVSLDALRGFDMLWIMGADRVIRSATQGSANPVAKFLHEQFDHVPWEGFHFYDFIFPLFLFMIGAAVPFALGKRVARGDSKASIYRHVFARGAVMIFFGMMINGNLLTYDPARFQLTYSVLQVLAIGYMGASLIYLNARVRTQLGLVAFFLALYWALETFVPVPGHVVGVYQPHTNFGDWLNDQILGSLQGPWRFGWIANTLTFVSTCTIGALAGQLLKSKKPHATKIRWMVLAGAGCVIAGWLWSLQFPIIKNRWTSTYALWCAGWSFLLLALFYWIVDVKGYRKWAFPFVVIGMNSIAAYMAWNLGNAGFRRFAEVFVAGLRIYTGGWYETLAAAASMFLCWLFLYWLYRSKIFLRI